jgi:hypothetical protein
MKFVATHPFADSDAAVRKPRSRTALKRCRMAAFISSASTSRFWQLAGSGEQFRAGLDRAIANGWLWLHESGTYVKFTDSGTILFA